VDEQCLYFGASLSAEGCEHRRAIDGLKCSYNVRRLVRLHGFEHRRCFAWLELLKEIGSCLGTHLVEDIASVVWGKVLEQVDGTFFIKGLKNVGGIVGVVFSKLFPRVMVSVEVFLGLLWPLTSEIAKR
jgi:hypothetical protein